MFRTLTPRQLAFDIGIAAFCVLLRAAVHVDGGITWLVVLGMAAALAIRRWSPALALALAWLVAIGQLIALRPPDISNIAILAVLFATARYGGTAVRWAGLVSAIAGAVVATAYELFLLYSGLDIGGANRFDPSAFPELVRAGAMSLIGALAVLVLSWTLGLLARLWSTARESRRAKARAERHVVVEQERNRIARDMHDVVAHSLAVVIAQADGARYAKGARAKDEALGTIADTARAALGDVRLLLGQLRHSQAAGPQPALADLASLLDQLRASGLAIDVVQTGEPVPLAAGQQLAVYRIVQEALTNALRHGSSVAPTTLRIDWDRDAVAVVITNPAGSTAAVNEHGHGLAGMRERALLVGGTFDAGPRSDAFVVSLTMPIRSEIAA